MKQKMSAMDVRALVTLLRRKVVGLRVANVYDVSGRLYLLKLAKGGVKEHLLIESGIRIHTTEFTKNKKDLPSGFSMKLRKHLRTKKLVSVRQLGMDRVIDIQFGRDEFAAHLIVELYAQGNVILTDHEYTILSLLRSYTLDAKQPDAAAGAGDDAAEGPVRCAVREKYPFSQAAYLTEDSILTDPEQIKRMIDDQFKKEEGAGDAPKPEASKDQETNQKGGQKGGKQKQQKGQKDQGKAQKAMTLKQVVQKLVPYSSAAYTEHVFRVMGVQGNAKATTEPSDNHVPILIEAATKLRDMVKELNEADDIKGFIVYREESEEDRKRKQEEEQRLRELIKQNRGEQLAEEKVEEEEFVSEQTAEIIKKFKGKMLKEFLPHCLLKQHEEAEEQYLEYDSFDQCVDEYFSQSEKQKEVSKNQSKESAIWQKMNRIKEDQEKRISGLQKEQVLSEFKALLLTKYIYEVQAIVDILQIMTNSGISWSEITRQIKEERKRNNDLANMIYKIDFEKQSMSLILDAVMEDEEEDQKFQIDDVYLTNFDPVVKVDVDLSISAQLNIQKYFEIKKKSHDKELKTKDAAEVAIQQAEKAALRDLEKHKITQMKDQNKNRKVFWFEKFLWFITSENYLVIGGKDAHQNELLVKKYMDKGDLFLHCELHGAAVCILKNPTKGIVPPMSIEEAASFEVCHSPSWTNNVLSQVYWVHAEQVSKTPPTGMYIATGSFIIRGKRNFVQPRSLTLGLTLMFALSEESLANHIGERKSRLEQEDVERMEKEREEERRQEEEKKKEREAAIEEAAKAESVGGSQAQKSELLDMSDIQIVTVGQVQGPRKNRWKQGQQNQDDMDAQSMMAKSISNFSVMKSQFGAAQSVMGGNAKAVGQPVFINNAQQNRQEQVQNQLAMQEAKKYKEQQQQEQKANKQKEKQQKQLDKGHDASMQMSKQKKNKIKKMKEKYGDQDEEEREMRMLLLGSKEVKDFDLQKHVENKNKFTGKDGKQRPQTGKKKGKKKEESEEEEESEESEQEAQESQERQEEAEVVEEEAAVEEENQIMEKEDAELDVDLLQDQADDIDPDAIMEENEEEGAQDDEDETESQAIQQLLKEEDITLVPESSDISELDKLTGLPNRKDALLFCIPMLAPYQTIQAYKYKVKITPGTQKRGRVQKTIKDLFVKNAKESKIETQFIKSVSDQEMTMVLVNGCKVAAAGLTLIQQQKKKEKKAAKPKKD